MKYVISFDTEFGCVSAESDDPEELHSAYPELRRIAQNLSTKPRERKRIGNNAATRKRTGTSISSKLPETTVILRELESRVLDSKFFEQPRTTGETREKLQEVTGRIFASRKVSQALGILKDRGKLRRKGKRNFFQYSLS